jgi:hypothetical protein
MTIRQHEWFRPDWLTAAWESCRVCGTVRRADGGNDAKSCPGPVGLRPMEPSTPYTADGEDAVKDQT